MAKERVLKLSDYTRLDETVVEKCREGVKKLESFVERYSEASNLEILEQLKEMENIKREHGAYLSYFIRFYSQVSMYRENGEFLASERKELKSDCIEELIKGGKNQTTADKIVYNQPDYKDGIKDIQDIRVFLIHIYETYDLHKNIISRNIHQSISVLQKELENLKRS